jgi:outer membrane protein TolC
VSQPGVSVPDGSSAFGLSAAWDVFTAGRRGAERKRADAVADASDLQLTDQRYGVVVDAQRSYFNVLRNTDLVRVAQARVERAQDGLNQAKNRHDAGTATLSDELRAQIELSTAQQALLSAIADLQVSWYALGRTVGSDEPVGAQAPVAFTARPLSMSNDEVMKLIVEQSPSVRAADASARAAGAGIAVARAKYLPSLQLTGAYRWADVATTPQFSQPGIWDVRLGMSLPLFDGLQREDAMVRAHTAADAASADAADRRRAARVAAERALTAFDLASQRIALAETALTAAQEDLRVQDARYRAGASTILERVTSQANLASAEATLVTVRYDYQVARAEIEALAGRSF